MIRSATIGGMCFEILEQGEQYVSIHAYHEPGDGVYSFCLDLESDRTQKLFVIVEVTECLVYSGENDTEQPCSETLAHEWFDSSVEENTEYLNESYAEALRMGWVR